ncbi:MAG: NAD(P)-binding domain-containing protein, partial [Chloroflexi bacterium]|nr:NAD(P)-binding domain-containing protein [Chloroflexota bacterium]
MDDSQRDSIVRAVVAELQRQGAYSGVQPQPGGNGNGRASVPRKPQSIAIIGGGHGGHAIGAHMTLKGFSVNLFSFYERELTAARERGGVEVMGGAQGFAKLNKITTSLDEAVKDVDMIMVVSPAVSHKTVASLLTPLLKDGQIIVLNPGRMG